jgi:hypothetical protein
MSNPELEEIQGLVREVMVTLQNSSGDVLTVNNFSLTAGQWDAQAPNGIPVQGYQIDPGGTPSYGNGTGTPFTGVAGSMSLGANAATVKVSWTWAYGAVPSASVSVTGSTTLLASVTLANTGSTQVTATVTFSGT